MHQTLLSWARWTLLAGVFAAGVSWAQSSSVFVGTVRDALTREPMPEVIVIITAPEKLGEEIVVTDDTGSYRISQLPPGTYRLRFEKENYQAFERQDVSLGSHKTLRINIEMAPSTLDAEEEIVVGRSPVIDVGSAAVGVTANEEFLRKIPLTRPGHSNTGSTSFTAVAPTAPGVQGDIYGYSIAGTTSPENAVFVDGLSVSNPGYGLVGTFISSEFMQDVSVLTGGFMPEYGRTTGGVISGVTKSGSNEFRGSVFASFTPGFLMGNPKSTFDISYLYGQSSKMSYAGEFGFDLGGPIVKDKLWFYVGFAPSMVKQEFRDWRSRIVDNSDAENPVVERLESSLRNKLYADNRGYSYIAKLSYQPAKNHDLSLQIFGAPSEAGGNRRWPASTDRQKHFAPSADAADDVSLGVSSEDSRDLILKYAGAFWEQKFLVDAHLGWHHQRSRFLPDDVSRIGAQRGLSSKPYIYIDESLDLADLADRGYIPLSPADRELCRANPGSCSISGFSPSGFFLQDMKMDRVSGRAMGTLLLRALGHHVLKAGVGFEYFSMDYLRAYSGGVYLMTDQYGGAEENGYGVLTGPDEFLRNVSFRTNPKSFTYGAFVQDSWSIFDKVTLNVGVRWDQQFLYGSDNKLALVVGNQWSPRASVVYDFMQNGKSKIFASYARLYETLPLSVIDSSFPGERKGGYYYSDDCNFVGEDAQAAFEKCAQARNRVPQANGAPNPSQYAAATGNQSALVDPDLKPQSTDEIVAGIEYEIFTDARLGFNYTRRYINHVIDDMSRDGGYTYFIGNPGFGIAKEFPKAVRNYNAFTVIFNKAFSNLWFVQASYTYATLKGNYAGLFSPDTEQLHPNANSDFDMLSLMRNRSGYLPADVRHQIQAHVSKDFELSRKLSLGLSLSYYGASGSPTSAYGDNDYGFKEVLVTPRGSGERTPWYNTVNAGLRVNVRLDKERVLTIGGTVFNVFNFRTVTSVDEVFTYSNVFPSGAKTPDDVCFKEDSGCTLDNPNALRGRDENGEVVVLPRSAKNKNFGKARGYQLPISARLEARITF